MTKTKKQLRAEAVERLKNCVAARFDAESIVIALTSDRRGQSDWSLECDKLIYLLTDDANDYSTPEKVVSGSEPCVTPESCRQYADQRKQVDDADCESCDSREKLEAEASELVAEYAASGDVCDALYHGMLGLLDRQAAITEEKTRYKWVTASAEEIAAWKSKAEKLKELNEYHALQYELASEDADRLQAQVDGLQSKLAEYEDRSMQFASLAGGTLYVGTKALTERIAELYSDLVKASDEREHYREKCSKMATIIHDALMVMDEGMA